MLSVPLQQCPTKRLRQLCIGLHEAGLLPSDLDTAKLQDRQYCTRLLAQLQLISGFEEQRQLCLPRPIFTVKTLQIILLSGFGETKANCKLKDQYLLKLGEIMQGEILSPCAGRPFVGLVLDVEPLQYCARVASPRHWGFASNLCSIVCMWLV